MDLQALLDQHGVKIVSRTNRFDMVRIGEFETKGDASAFLASVQELPGIRLPTSFDPIWAPPNKPCSIDIGIGEDNPLLPPYTP